MHRLDCPHTVSTVHTPSRPFIHGLNYSYTVETTQTPSRLFIRLNCPNTLDYSCSYIHRLDCLYAESTAHTVQRINSSYTVSTFQTCSYTVSTVRTPSKLLKHRLDCSSIRRLDCSYAESTVHTPFRPYIHVVSPSQLFIRRLNCPKTVSTVHTQNRLFIHRPDYSYIHRLDCSYTVPTVHRLPSYCLWGALRRNSNFSPKSKPSLSGWGSRGSYSLL